MRKTKYVFIVLLLLVAAAEVMTFAYSVLAAREAEKLTELLATLKPGYTTMDSAKAVFQAHGVNVSTLRNACGDPRGACDGLYVGATNHHHLVWLRHNPPLGLELFPVPPVKRAGFAVDLYFINGILDSINAGYGVGTTDVKYSRGVGEYNSIWSKWAYEKGGTVQAISVSSSGTDVDLPFPRFAFNYMYSVKCVDARMLWPSAPPPTTEIHGWLGCR